jgi:hypothetical protein
VIDTEHGSASLYANTFGFDVLDLDDYSPERFIAALQGRRVGRVRRRS